MQNLLEMGVKSHEAWLKNEFYHICLSVCLCAIGIWSRSSLRVTQCRLPQCWCRQNNWSCTEISPFTDCNKKLKNHFCCKFWNHLLYMKPFYWFKWYKWLKMAFKMSQEFPTASLNTAEDFQILPSAYVDICYSILKQKHTTGSLTHTHTHTHMTINNYKQKASGHVTNGHFTRSDALFVCKILIASSDNKK